MPVNLPIPLPETLLPVAGVRLGVAEAGVRKANRKDVTVLLLDEGTTVGAVFTQTGFVLRQFKFVVSILRPRVLQVHVRWLSTPAMPMRVPEPRACCVQRACARRWLPSWVSAMKQVLPFSLA